MDMEYRTLGGTNLSVGVISLGCGGFEDKDRKQVCAELRYAMERGASFLDLFASGPDLRSNIGAAIAGQRDKICMRDISARYGRIPGIVISDQIKWTKAR